MDQTEIDQFEYILEKIVLEYSKLMSQIFI